MDQNLDLFDGVGGLAPTEHTDLFPLNPAEGIPFDSWLLGTTAELDPAEFTSRWWPAHTDQLVTRKS